MEMIRRATQDDVARIVEIARAAYIKYVPRIGREPPPMLADFAAEVAAGHVVVIEIARAVGGLFDLLAQNGSVFHRQHRCRPSAPGFGIGTTANGICCARSEASQLIRHPALHQRDNDRESCDVRPYGICRNPSCDGDAIPYRDRFPSGLYASDASLKAKTATRNPSKVSWNAGQASVLRRISPLLAQSGHARRSLDVSFRG